MNLHNEIMNIPMRTFNKTGVGTGHVGFHYAEGHRDARHAAAELALKADTLIEDMKDELQYILDWLEQGDVDDSFSANMKNLIQRAKELK